MARAPYISLLIIIVLSTLINILALGKGHYWGDDFALYIAQAKSLVEGKTEKLLAQNTFTVSRSSYPFGPNLAPWGFPIILSPVYAIFGLNLAPMKITGMIFFELSLLLMFYIFLGNLKAISTLLLVSFFAFNPFSLLLNDHINSDAPFLFFSLLSIFIIQKTVAKATFSNHRVTVSLLIGFIIFLSYNIRVIGFTLLLFLLTVQVTPIIRMHGMKCLKYIVSNKLFFLPYAAFVLSAVIIRFLLPSGSESYLSNLPPVNLTSIKNQIYYYISLPSEFFRPYYSSIIYGATIPFAALGIHRNFKVDYSYILYFFLTLSVMIIVPYPGGLRYFLPIFPFYIYFLCIGLNTPYTQFQATVFNLIVTVRLSFIFMSIIIFLLASYSIQVAYLNSNSKKTIDGPFTETSLEMFNFISHHTREDDVIVFFKPRILRLLTGRQSIMIEDFSQLMRSSGGYLVIRKRSGIYDPISPGYDQISPFSSEFSQIAAMFPMMFENTGFIIFRLKRLAEAK